MTTLLAAHRQWATRPADERFFDLEEMRVVAQEMKDQAKEPVTALGSVRVEKRDEDLVLVGSSGASAQVSHLAFGQLAADIGAPAGYLRTLPATLAAQNLNYGLNKIVVEKDAQGAIKTDTKLLINSNGQNVLRALTSEKYKRLFNVDLIDKMVESLPEGLRTPRAWPVPGMANQRIRKATADDVMPCSIIREGDDIAPAGCYLNDRSMFVFLVDPTRPIRTGTKMELYRGAIFWNSEVGTSTFGGMAFEFGAACGNHRISAAQNVTEFRFQHRGDLVAKSAQGFDLTVRKFLDSSVSDEEARIASEQRYIVGQDKVAVIEAILGFAKKKKLDIVTNKLLAASFDAAEEHSDWYGDPRSLYGITNGMTETAQKVTSNVDERHAIDVAAGKIASGMLF